MDINKEVKQLILSGKLEKAFQLFTDHLNKHNLDPSHEFLLCKFRYEKLIKEKLLDLKSKAELDREERNIVSQFLGILDTFDDSTYSVYKKETQDSSTGHDESPKDMGSTDASEEEEDYIQSLIAQDPNLETVMQEIARLVQFLKKKNENPTVNGIDLFGFGDEYEALAKFLLRYSILNSLDDLRRILYWKHNLCYDLTGNHVALSSLPNATVQSLYQAIFDQPAWQANLATKQKKINLVIFRRGSSRELTTLLNSFPFVNQTIIVSATDDGESWYEPARAFKATGVPGAAKALLDLANNKRVKDFLSIRIVLEAGKPKNDHEHESKPKKRVRERIHWLINKMENPQADTPNIVEDTTDINNILQVAMRIPTKSRQELVLYLKKTKEWFSTYTHDTDNIINYQFIPIRNLLLLGICLFLHDEDQANAEKDHELKKEKEINELDLTAYWQDAIDRMAEILEVHDGSRVLFPTLARQHLLAVRADGTIYFSEAPINYYKTGAPFSGIWTINKTIDADYINQVKRELSTIAFNTINSNERISTLSKSWQTQIFQTTFDVGKEHVHIIAKDFQERSEKSRADDPTCMLSEDAKKAIEEADIILADSRRLASNVGGALITEGLYDVIKRSHAVKICLSAVKKDNYAMPRKDLEDMYRYVSGK